MKWETLALCFPNPKAARKAHDTLERVIQKTRLIGGLKKNSQNLREYTEDMIELVERHRGLSTSAKRDDG